ncbi:unnamed protein product [Larinioides sclopetarius]|uniref:Uncharacterized protein n=1 Tax=Larinioides sclopetarius TaxID=280406 RepID=A0AAV2ARR3_9ARAC
MIGAAGESASEPTRKTRSTWLYHSIASLASEKQEEGMEDGLLASATGRACLALPASCIASESKAQCSLLNYQVLQRISSTQRPRSLSLSRRDDFVDQLSPFIGPTMFALIRS